jgi:hypothetical protein
MKSPVNSRLIFPLAVSLLAALHTAVGASFTTTPTADAYVATGPTGNLSNNNYGGGGALAIAAPGLPNGEFQTVIKFDLAPARASFDATYGAGAWSVESVSLQLSSSPHNNAIYNNIAPGSFGISLMQNNSWVEGSGNASAPGSTGITYNSLVSTFENPTADQALGTFAFPGGSSGANIYSLDLSPGLASDIMAGNQVTLRLDAADNQVSYLFTSRAATLPADQPQLVITTVPEPGTVLLFGLGAATLVRRRKS